MNNRNLTLCPAPADQLLALAQELALTDPWHKMGFSRPALLAYLERSDPGRQLTGLMVDNQLAGIAVTRHPWLRGPYLELFFIRESFRSEGLAGRYLALWESEARERQDRNLWVAVSDFNHHARKTYEKHGFRETALLPDLVSAGFTEILMRKLLLD